MNLNIDDLCKDPLFQLNLAIWLAQPQLSQYSCIYPLFYKSGLNIYSIGPLLALPPDIRLVVTEKINCQNAVRPDLILETQGKKKFCVLECKSSSFGSDSSAASQARTLLLIAGPVLSEVLAIGKRGENKGILCYFIGPNNIELMERTLEDLERGIKEKANLESGNYGCFQIRSSQSEIILEYPEKTKRFLNLMDKSPIKVIQFEEDTDPRPLYFIPYDPNINQTKQEQQFCRRVLFERILSYVISNIGGTTIPTSVTFTTDELLNSATFRMYEIWEDNDAKRHIRRLVKDFLMEIKTRLNEPIRENISYEPQKGWIFNLKDRETYEEFLKQLHKFKPETLDLSKKVEPTLFDNMEN
ncbi:hypothetical protein IBX65_04255 [Candidatus Aerophobetes bacterium]|nr:hypothetical protein [Candidatus Aerophobetes bacterium]